MLQQLIMFYENRFGISEIQFRANSKVDELWEEMNFILYLNLYNLQTILIILSTNIGNSNLGIATSGLITWQSQII